MAVPIAPVLAQLADAEEEVIEEIVVTGSRFERDPNLAGTLPVQTVTSERIQHSGELEVASVLRDIPALQSSSTSEQSFATGGYTGPNTNVLNLRSLGIERTLTLINGRRHVPSQRGSSAVDVGSIPGNIIERVEVLTGAASAVYGADAVTGVVNFILNDDFEGLTLNASTGISDRSDSEQLRLSGTWGQNFRDDRGNITVAVDYQYDRGLLRSDRPNRSYLTSSPAPNPDLRFQLGDIDPTTTPNFAAFYDFNNTGLYHFGLPIPDQQEFADFYAAFFGSSPNFTAGELALFDRAARTPPLAILKQHEFPITSAYGRIVPGNPFAFQGFDPTTPIDLDGNGTPDCLDSFTGYNSSFAPAAFGILGGCWNVSASGEYGPIRNGLISNDFESYGGDSVDEYSAEPYDLIFPNERIAINLLGHYDVNERLTLFTEAKYSRQGFEEQIVAQSAWDNLFGAPDNPFLPEFIQPLAQQLGGVAITVDPVYEDPFRDLHYETARIVIGAKGEFANGWRFETSLNYGESEADIVNHNQIIVDRWFAAIDAVVDPATGQPACRSEVDPSAPLITTPFGIPQFDPGYFTFTPGDGQCLPLNIWAGQPGVSRQALDWVTTDDRFLLNMDQLVLTAFVLGDSSDWFELTGGPLQLIAGVEYREESSKEGNTRPLRYGIIPEGAPFPAGSNVADWSNNGSLTFSPEATVRPESGEYDVADLFFEVSAPIVTDRPGVRELLLEAAVRFSDYSSVGSTTTWKANLLYSPVYSFSFRGSYGIAVRAPNISELFSPLATRIFPLNDPCDANLLAGIANEDPEAAAQTQANCVQSFNAIGLDPFDPVTGNYAFFDLTQGGVRGQSGGNPDLNEEEATTTTFGFIFQPTWLPGMSITVDYWDIDIEGAIDEVFGTTIVNGCYIGSNLNPTFCNLLSREDDPNSFAFGAVDFIRSTNINLARFQASGVDFDFRYTFDVSSSNFMVGMNGSWLENHERFDNPLDPSDSESVKGNIMRPEWSGNVFVDWSWQAFNLAWQTRYTGKQLLSFATIETYLREFGPSVVMDAAWVHDLNGAWDITDRWSVYAGIRNLTNEGPYITDIAWPASARGRYYFAGFNVEVN